MQDKNCLMHAALTQRISDMAEAGQVADAVANMWRKFGGVLSPVIGQRGFSELFRRSVHLACTDYPWLVAVYQGTRRDSDFTVFRTVLSQQTLPHAMDASATVLQNFYNLLSKLIGISLADRLFQSLWETISSGDPAQDTSP